MDSWTDAADASEGGGPAPSVEVQNRSDQDTTLVRCGGFNRTGQLAALTIAISSFGLQIKSTFIRTDNDAADVDDLFYVQTREGEPVPLDQHDALVRHVERALGLPPSAVDTLQAARDAGFIGHAAQGSNDGSNAGVDHTYGGGYDERAQELAREEAAFREAQGSASRGGGGGGGGGFFGDDVLGSSLFDPSTYASYGNSNAGSREEETHEAAEETQHHGGFFDTPHGPEVPDASFFDSQFDGGGGDAFAAPDPPAAPAAQASGGGSSATSGVPPTSVPRRRSPASSPRSSSSRATARTAGTTRRAIRARRSTGAPTPPPRRRWAAALLLRTRTRTATTRTPRPC